MRAIRFALEYAKAELLLRDWGIRSTIIVFGSARMPSPEQAEAAVGGRGHRLRRRRMPQRLQRAGEVLRAPRASSAASPRSAAARSRRSTAGATTSSPPAAARASWRRPTAARPMPARRASASTSRCRRSRSPTPIHAGADLPLPLLRHAQDAPGHARQCAGGVPRRLRHHGRAVRDADPSADAQGAAGPDRAVRPRPTGAGSSTSTRWPRRA